MENSDLLSYAIYAFIDFLLMLKPPLEVFNQRKIFDLALQTIKLQK